MIAEAIDTVLTLGWALLAWIVLLALVVTGTVYAAVAAVWAVGRTLRAAWRRARKAGMPIPAAPERVRRPQTRSRPLASTEPLPEAPTPRTSPRPKEAA